MRRGQWSDRSAFRIRMRDRAGDRGQRRRAAELHRLDRGRGHDDICRVAALEALVQHVHRRQMEGGRIVLASRMSKNTLVSLDGHFEGFIEEQIARGRHDPFAVR